MKPAGHVEAIVLMIVLMSWTSYSSMEAAPGTWTDPAGDVTLPNSDIISGSATVSGGMVDLRVQLAAPPFPTGATQAIGWCLDTDQNASTGGTCGGAVSGADNSISLDGGLGALSTCDFSIGSGSLTIDPYSSLWYDPATITLRLLFPLSLISADPVFNYSVASDFGGSFGANERAPDSIDFGTPGNFFTSDAGEPLPFNGSLLCTRQQVEIDIQPGNRRNNINPRSHGPLEVAVLTTGDFDATTVDPTSVLFGPSGTEAGPTFATVEDVDGDGDTDLMLQFSTPATGFECGDAAGTLKAVTFSRRGIEGSDSIRTVGCP